MNKPTATLLAILLLLCSPTAEAGDWVAPKVSAPDPVTQRWSFREKNVLERAEDFRLCEKIEASALAQGLLKAEARYGPLYVSCLESLGYRWKD